MPTETIVAARWIYGLLAADAAMVSLVAGRIFAYRVPEGVLFPCVMFQLQAAELDSRVVGEFRLASRMTLTVKAVGQGADFVGIAPIAKRVDELLEAGSGSDLDGLVVACVRERPIEYLETSDVGIDYVHLGGLYRVTVQGT